jgi:hypothetical protein
MTSLKEFMLYLKQLAAQNPHPTRVAVDFEFKPNGELRFVFRPVFRGDAGLTGKAHVPAE